MSTHASTPRLGKDITDLPNSVQDWNIVSQNQELHLTSLDDEGIETRPCLAELKTPRTKQTGRQRFWSRNGDAKSRPVYLSGSTATADDVIYCRVLFKSTPNPSTTEAILLDAGFVSLTSLQRSILATGYEKGRKLSEQLGIDSQDVSDDGHRASREDQRQRIIERSRITRPSSPMTTLDAEHLLCLSRFLDHLTSTQRDNRRRDTSQGIFRTASDAFSQFAPAGTLQDRHGRPRISDYTPDIWDPIVGEPQVPFPRNAEGEESLDPSKKVEESAVLLFACSLISALTALLPESNVGGFMMQSDQCEFIFGVETDPFCAARSDGFVMFPSGESKKLRKGRAARNLRNNAQQIVFTFEAKRQEAKDDQFLDHLVQLAFQAITRIVGLYRGQQAIPERGW